MFTFNPKAIIKNSIQMLKRFPLSMLSAIFATIIAIAIDIGTVIEVGKYVYPILLSTKIG